MKGPCFVDTNVFVYALDADEEGKQARAHEVLAAHAGDIVVSTQVLLELHAVCTRKLGLSRAQARSAVEAVARHPVVAADRELILRAAELAERAELSIFDAAIIVAARRAGATSVLSEDLSSRQDYDGVVVENPFAT